MGERSSFAPGTFSWVDLGTIDPEGAKAFYARLFGWETQDTSAGEAGTYTMCLLDGKPVAAVYERPEGGQAPSDWLSYIAVTGIDQLTPKVAELGGTVVVEPFDVADSGRASLIKDPTGAFLGLWQAAAHPGAGRVNEAGCFGWNELATSDVAAAARFYESLLGWRTNRMDGSDGYLVVENDGRMNGGMRARGDGEAEEPGWTVFFTVEDVDIAVAKVQELGGAVVRGPMSLPSGRLAAVEDPQGATFVLFQGDVDD
jgi:hypothetical protein